MILESNASKKNILFSSENVPHEHICVASIFRQTDFGLQIQMQKDIDHIIRHHKTGPNIGKTKKTKQKINKRK